MEPMSVVAITGHRPEKIPDVKWVEDTLTEVLTTVAPKKLVQGMAAGVDLLSAQVALRMNIPLMSVRPWAGHTPRFQDVKLYQKAVVEAVEVVDVHPSTSYLGPWMYQDRNKYMVDHATVVVAVWDGTKGGTRNCVVYARQKGVPVILIDPAKKTVTYPEPEVVEPEPDEREMLF
jgi:uncharacterized phage-like protein YoqJ